MTTTTMSTDLPAIAGGKPIKSTPYRRLPRYGEEELAELREALAQGTLFYAGGKKVHELEKQFAAHQGAAFGIACSSGTTGLHAAIIAAGVSPDDEVIVPPITDMGTVLPILWQRAVPIFVDLEARSGNIDPDAVKKAITPKTRAVMAVHLGGNPCNLRALKRICDEHNLFLIEDCAQAHGATYGGKPVGSVGHVGCFSYNEFKHISCGDGGLIVTSDAALAAKLRLATDKAYDRSPGVAVRDPKFLANNYRMTELQAAVALAQLRKLDSIVQRRQNWCERLARRIETIAGLQTPAPAAGSTHSYWFHLMRVDASAMGASADEFAAALVAEGLPVRAHYIGRPMYRYPIFAQHSAFERGGHPFDRIDYTRVRCPSAEAILDTCVILAINEDYSDEDLDETARAFHRVAGYFRGKRS